MGNEEMTLEQERGLREIGKNTQVKIGRARTSLLILQGLLLLGAFFSSFLGGPGHFASAQGSGSPQLVETGFPKAGQINGNRVNIRTGPSTNHFALTQLPHQTRVVATASQGDWVRFILPPTVKLWISQNYVQSTGDGRLRVSGNQVQIRVRPNTTYTPVGKVQLGNMLIPTGAVDDTDRTRGAWVQIEAPSQASGWIHREFIDLGSALNNQQVARFYPRAARGPGTAEPSHRGELSKSGPKPAVGGDEGGLVDASTGRKAPELPFPAAGREPLVAIYEQLRIEQAKVPSEWNFAPILKELRVLSVGTEDLVVAAAAKQWIDVIESEWVPVQRRMAALEIEKEEARRLREIAEAKEQKFEEKPVQDSTRQDKRFVAVGWVSTLGKYRKVDGTHRLLKGNQLMFYLKSEQLKLDGYVNKRVGISGVIQEQPPSAGAQLIHVTGIEILSD